MKCIYMVAVAAALASTAFLAGCEKNEDKPALPAKTEQVGQKNVKTAEKTVATATKTAEKTAKDAGKAADSLKK